MTKVLLMVLFLLFGLVLIYTGGKDVYRAHVSPYWPTAEATVVSSSVRTLRGKRDVHYRPEVQYQFTVDGTPYTADTIAFGGKDTSFLPNAQSVTDQYTSGMKVTVHHAPEDPSMACIECGWAHANSYMMMLGGLFGTVLFAVGLNRSLRDWRLLSRMDC